jgi:hypothetical protein
MFICAFYMSQTKEMNLHIMVQHKNLQNKGKSKKNHDGLNP